MKLFHTTAQILPCSKARQTREEKSCIAYQVPYSDSEFVYADKLSTILNHF